MLTHTRARSSQIDTTAVQALIDTRTEVERWADRPVEFHFATILSPWVRRALVAGGFGTGTPLSNVPREIAAVVPYRGGVEAPARVDKAEDEESKIPDVVEEERQFQEEPSPLDLEDTPFFHFDLVSAVRAAEAGLRAQPAVTLRSSTSTLCTKQKMQEEIEERPV